VIQGTVAANFLKAFVVEKHYPGVKGEKPLTAKGAEGSRRTLRRAKTYRRSAKQREGQNKRGRSLGSRPLHLKRGEA
jgi:hypothetical protein